MWTCVWSRICTTQTDKLWCASSLRIQMSLLEKRNKTAADKSRSLAAEIVAIKESLAKVEASKRAGMGTVCAFYILNSETLFNMESFFVYSTSFSPHANPQIKKKAKKRVISNFFCGIPADFLIYYYFLLFNKCILCLYSAKTNKFIWHSLPVVQFFTYLLWKKVR